MNINERTQHMAIDYITGEYSVRELAQKYGIGRTTANNDLTKRLKEINIDLWECVMEISLDKRGAHPEIYGSNNERKDEIRKEIKRRIEERLDVCLQC